MEHLLDLQTVALIAFAAGVIGGCGLTAGLLAGCRRCAARDAASVLTIEAPSEEAFIAHLKGARVVLSHPRRRHLRGLSERAS